jgi:hypothetical protein
MPDKAEESFEIGLALAGAISAGAYTAGVLDFLFQALHEWQRARGTDNVPNHNVVLSVVAGASAGAITGALGAVALARGLQPQEFTAEETANSYREKNVKYQQIRCVLPPLYDTWVTRPRMVSADGGIDFLSDEDLRDAADPDQASVLSLLNAKLLDDIKHRALVGDGAIVEEPYPFVADPLHVYMTVSNLRGIPFKVEFGNSSYGMQTHGDRVHYAISCLGASWGHESDWVSEDKHLPLNIRTLPAPGPSAPLPREWDAYGTSALASSAFPIGLASREIEAPIGQYHGRQYPFRLDGAAINPDFPAGWSPKKFAFRNIDGGLINNNPFDYAQYALAGKTATLKTTGTEADKAVIMIAPFPEPPTFLPDGQPRPELINVVRALFPTLINQARFRASELAPAMNSQDYARFLVAPHRKLPREQSNDIEERYKIACGLLGGFGGFLDEKFRAHDFQLGRRNCQAFLRRTFALPAGNPIVAPMVGQPAYKISPDRQNSEERYPIIPLLGSAADEVPLPHWPRMSRADFNVLLKRIEGRFNIVAPALIRAQTASVLLRGIARIGLRFGRGRLLKYIRWTILSDLVRRDQIDGWELPPPIVNLLSKHWRSENSTQNSVADDIRVVLAELASPAFDFRTAAGIATMRHLDEKFVAEVLQEFRQIEQQKPFSVWEKGGEELFTLTSRKPGRLRSLPVINGIADWLDPPAADRNSAGRQFGG